MWTERKLGEHWFFARSTSSLSSIKPYKRSSVPTSISKKQHLHIQKSNIKESRAKSPKVEVHPSPLPLLYLLPASPCKSNSVFPCSLASLCASFNHACLPPSSNAAQTLASGFAMTPAMGLFNPPDDEGREEEGMARMAGAGRSVGAREREGEPVPVGREKAAAELREGEEEVELVAPGVVEACCRAKTFYAKTGATC